MLDNDHSQKKPTPGFQFRGLIAIIGVCGSGKSTLGEKLATCTAAPFFDADDFHSEKNRNKMASGQPLEDEDRWTWLNNINQACRKAFESHGRLILAAPGHKESYRAILCEGIAPAHWFYLHGPMELIHNRMKQRDHFMPPGLLASQFAIMDPPEYATVLDVSKPLDALVSQVLKQVCSRANCVYSKKKPGFPEKPRPD